MKLALSVLTLVISTVVSFVLADVALELVIQHRQAPFYTNLSPAELAKLPVEKRVEALQKLNADPCTCGCGLTVARCRVDDPHCSVSLPAAQKIVADIVARK